MIYGQKSSQQCVPVALKRRICEVMRVLSGLGLINDQMNILALTSESTTIRRRECLQRIKQAEEQCQYLCERLNELNKQRQ